MVDIGIGHCVHSYRTRGTRVIGVWSRLDAILIKGNLCEMSPISCGGGKMPFCALERTRSRFGTLLKLINDLGSHGYVLNEHVCWRGNVWAFSLIRVKCDPSTMDYISCANSFHFLPFVYHIFSQADL